MSHQRVLLHIILDQLTTHQPTQVITTHKLTITIQVIMDLLIITTQATTIIMALLTTTMAQPINMVQVIITTITTKGAILTTPLTHISTPTTLVNQIQQEAIFQVVDGSLFS